ncbi:MAG TPA: hypothetical protein VFV64_03105 [Permianibacter sp.]|nr:hypothetical protein [Permianibacter sp.]
MMNTKSDWGSTDRAANPAARSESRLCETSLYETHLYEHRAWQTPSLAWTGAGLALPLPGLYSLLSLIGSLTRRPASPAAVRQSPSG